jgi:hypothetical protein
MVVSMKQQLHPEGQQSKASQRRQIFGSDVVGSTVISGAAQVTSSWSCPREVGASQLDVARRMRQAPPPQLVSAPGTCAS